MRILPAIDLKNGRAVRLKKGNYDDMTVYSDDPVSIAEGFKRMGAEMIHVVDLDGARTGDGINEQMIRRIVDATGLKVETGGGIRSLDNIAAKLEAGATRVIIGTMAVREPEFVGRAIERFGAERIVVGLDGRGGKAATEGWEKDSTTEILELALRFREMGALTVIYTDISRDGMLCGPDLEYTERLVKETGMEIVASGGVGCSEDLRAVERTGAQGVIVGKAYYEGRIDLEREIADRK